MKVVKVDMAPALMKLSVQQCCWLLEKGHLNRRFSDNDSIPMPQIQAGEWW